MIVWRKGLKGLVGGAKTLIKGVLNYTHTATSETITPTSTPTPGSRVITISKEDNTIVFPKEDRVIMFPADNRDIMI